MVLSYFHFPRVHNTSGPSVRLLTFPFRPTHFQYFCQRSNSSMLDSTLSSHFAQCFAPATSDWQSAGEFISLTLLLLYKNAKSQFSTCNTLPVLSWCVLSSSCFPLAKAFCFFFKFRPEQDTTSSVCVGAVATQVSTLHYWKITSYLTPQPTRCCPRVEKT